MSNNRIIKGTNGEDVILTCPLGGKCLEIKDNKSYRCNWYQGLTGKPPLSDKEETTWDCVFPLILTATLENARTNRGQTEAITYLRNYFVQLVAESKKRNMLDK